MTDTNDTPALVEFGANKRGAADSVNLDVSGAPGPDYLGQETANVDGHPADRPGVTSRLPEEDPTDPRISRMDTGEELPVLLDSSMRADPIEGVQGTYTQIIEGECARCGYDRLTEAVHTLAGEHQQTCNACGARQDSRNPSGYAMPTTQKERAQMRREAGPTLGSVDSRDVIDLEPDTGYGARLALVDEHSSTSLHKDDVGRLLAMLIDADGPDAVDSLRDSLSPIKTAAIAAVLLPDGWTMSREDDEEAE